MKSLRRQKKAWVLPQREQILEKKWWKVLLLAWKNTKWRLLKTRLWKKQRHRAETDQQAVVVENANAILMNITWREEPRRALVWTPFLKKEALTSHVAPERRENINPR